MPGAPSGTFDMSDIGFRLSAVGPNGASSFTMLAKCSFRLSEPGDASIIECKSN